MDNVRFKDAWSFLNCQVKAHKLSNMTFKSLPEVGIMGDTTEVQIRGLIPLCKEINMPYTREEWDANEHCQSDYDIAYFWYKGIKFFELLDKDEYV